MAVPVVALKCPVCGAPFQPDSDRCGYCGSILVLKTNHPRIDPRLLNKAVVDEHIAEYRSSLRSDPYDETAHYGLGVAYFNLGLIEDSIRELTEAAKLMPENPNIQTQLAVVLREAVRQGAVGAEEQMHYRIGLALRLDPNYLEALLLQAEYMSDSESGHDRIEILEKAYLLDENRVRPNLVDALIKLAASQQRLEEWDGLSRTWRRLADVDPELAKSLMTKFLAENRKLISSRPVLDRPTAKASWSKVLPAIGAFAVTLLVGAFLVGLVTQAYGETSNQYTIGLVAWLAALVAVPIWVGKRNSQSEGPVRPTVSQSAWTQEHSELPAIEEAVAHVLRRKQEQKARTAFLREMDERERAKRDKRRPTR